MTRLVTAFLTLTMACGGDTRPTVKGEHHGDKEHEEHEASEQTSVHLAPEAIARNKIRVAEVVLEPFLGGTDVPAEIELIPDHVAHVTSLIAGQVVSAEVSVGDQVAKGQLLATLRSAEVGQARSALTRARASLEAARANYERQQVLEKEGIGAQRALQEARAAYEAAQAELEGFRAQLNVYGAGGQSGASVSLRAPIAGTVLERHATTGEISKPDEPLFVVADTARVWAIGRVYEQNVGRVAMGAPVTLRLAAYPDRTWKGTIGYVASVLDDKSRTLPVRVELDNPDGLLRPGLYGTLTLANDPTGAMVPVVPEDAVQRVDDRDIVFVPGDEAGEFRAVPVQIGARDRGRVAIASGLERGARVVVSGAFVIKSELLRDQMGEGHAH